MLELTEGRVRAWVAAGFVDPRRGDRGELSFSFQDLVVLKAAKGLADSEVSSRRMRRALEGLRKQLPEGRSLAGVRIAADGARVVVRQGGEAWEPDSGQRRIDFEVAELAERAAPLASTTAARAAAVDGLTADDWFELGCDLEATSPEEGMAAYRRVLELDEGHTDARLNLGRLLHEAGDVEAAARHYLVAAEARPRDATAAFNLGVALQDLDRPSDAIDAYRKAISEDPAYADAYFNLADLYEKLGKEAMAIQNLKIYRELTRA